MKYCLFLILLTTVAAASFAQDSTFKKEIIGKYKFPAGSVVEEVNVAEEGGMLTMASSVGTSALEQVKGDTFNIVSFNGIAVFKRNDQRKVVGVHIDASGYVLDGVKDSVGVAPKILYPSGSNELYSPRQLLVAMDYHPEALIPVQRRRMDNGLLAE